MNSTSSAVYAICLQWPSGLSLTLGSVKTSSTTTASLLGYGSVDWKSDSMGRMVITIPSLPLDTNLQWAWTIKLENVSPAFGVRQHKTRQGKL